MNLSHAHEPHDIVLTTGHSHDELDVGLVGEHFNQRGGGRGGHAQILWVESGVRQTSHDLVDWFESVLVLGRREDAIHVHVATQVSHPLDVRHKHISELERACDFHPLHLNREWW